MYSLKNSQLKIQIKQTGAELSSIVANDKEYLWEGNPEYWSGQAPILFPFVGRFKNDQYEYQGKQYSLPQHGFFRRSNAIHLIEESDTKLTFSIKSDESTLKNYPFEFEFITSYELIKNKIIIHHKIINLGKQNMLFSLGEHPAFNCSLIDKTAKHDTCYLEFEKTETASISLITNEGLISADTKEIMNNTNTLKLPKTVFDGDALVFKKMNSKKVSLVNYKEGKLVTLTYEDFPNLGIWAKPMAPYVCIEPWLGFADSHDTNHKLEDKKGLLNLKVGDNYQASYTIEVHTTS